MKKDVNPERESNRAKVGVLGNVELEAVIGGCCSMPPQDIPPKG